MHSKTILKVYLFLLLTSSSLLSSNAQGEGWMYEGGDWENTRYYQPSPKEEAPLYPMYTEFSWRGISGERCPCLTGDVDWDGALEIVTLSNRQIVIIENDGSSEILVNADPNNQYEDVYLDLLVDSDDDGRVDVICLGTKTAGMEPRLLFYSIEHNELRLIKAPYMDGDQYEEMVDKNNDGKWYGGQRVKAVVDLDGNGSFEVVAFAWSYGDLQPRGVYIYDYETGNEIWHKNFGPIPTECAIGNLDEDTGLEIVVSTQCEPRPEGSEVSEANGYVAIHGHHFIFIIDEGEIEEYEVTAAHEFLPPFDTTPPPQGEYHFCDLFGTGVSLADLDGDRDLDIIIAPMVQSTYGYYFWVLKNDGNGGFGEHILISEEASEDARNKYSILLNLCRPIICDWDNDEKKDIIIAGGYTVRVYIGSKLINGDNTPKNEISTEFNHSYLCAGGDLDGDGQPEFILSSEYHYGEFEPRIHILERDLSFIQTFELDEAGMAVVSDLIPDEGTSEVIIFSPNGLFPYLETDQKIIVYQSVLDEDPPWCWIEKADVEDVDWYVKGKDYYIRGAKFTFAGSDNRCPAELLEFSFKRQGDEEWSDWTQEKEVKVEFSGPGQQGLSIKVRDGSGNPSSPVTYVLDMLRADASCEIISHEGHVTISIPRGAILQDGILRIAGIDRGLIKDVPDGTTLVGCYEIQSSSALHKRIQVGFRLEEEIPGARYAVYKEVTSGWERIGGTFDATQDRIFFPTQTFGKYGVFAEKKTVDISSITPYLDCQPRVFSPGEGNLCISFSLVEASTVTIKIYNLAGRVVRVVADSEEYGSGAQTAEWNGIDENGAQVPNGLYICTLDDGEGVRTKVFSVLEK